MMATMWKQLLFITFSLSALVVSGCAQKYKHLDKSYPVLLSDLSNKTNEPILWSASCEFGSTVAKSDARTQHGLCVLGARNFFLVVEEPATKGPRIYSRISLGQLEKLGSAKVSKSEPGVTQVQMVSKYRTFFLNVRDYAANVLLESEPLKNIPLSYTGTVIGTDYGTPSVIYVSPIVIPKKK
jgi:hypothetical protein